MPLTIAAMEGIKEFGHKWKFTLPIKGFTREYLEEMTDNKLAVIAKQLRRYGSRFVNFPGDLEENGVPCKLEEIADWFEMATPGDVEEVECIMEELYDFCDYYRICITK